MNNMLERNSNTRNYSRKQQQQHHSIIAIDAIKRMYMCTYRTESTPDGYNRCLLLPLLHRVQKIEQSVIDHCFCLICLWIGEAFLRKFIFGCRMCENEDVCRRKTEE